MARRFKHGDQQGSCLTNQDGRALTVGVSGTNLRQWHKDGLPSDLQTNPLSCFVALTFIDFPQKREKAKQGANVQRAVLFALACKASRDAFAKGSITYTVPTNGPTGGRVGFVPSVGGKLGQFCGRASSF